MSHSVVWVLQKRRRVPALVISESDDSLTCFLIDDDFVDETDGNKVVIKKTAADDFLLNYSKHAPAFKKSNEDASDFLKQALQLSGANDHPDARSVASEDSSEASEAFEASSSAEEEEDEEEDRKKKPQRRQPAARSVRASEPRKSRKNSQSSVNSDQEVPEVAFQRPQTKTTLRRTVPEISRDIFDKISDDQILKTVVKYLPSILREDGNKFPSAVLAVRIARLDPAGVFGLVIGNARNFSVNEQRQLWERLKRGIEAGVLATGAGQ